MQRVLPSRREFLLSAYAEHRETLLRLTEAAEPLSETPRRVGVYFAAPQA
ncbi:hypothetical protein [Paraburkholderia kirstenboschensis]|uniref:Uncharacterized protein n=1 Tax=Paraburkholderia kirstenboschensis TaxID=1245436 RepID=A0ABZ0EK16_9BURK|nr:hypothetical protein [Paraburkholderia kirstenboschensis]WOD17539.1 hypothetical protein RW095_32580 [Paraburkholderia kirstenboschensis]